LNETTSEKTLKVPVFWKDSKYDNEPYADTDTVADFIQKFLEKNGKDQLSDISYYHLFFLDDPPKVLDASELIADVVNKGHPLLLSKNPGHVETRRDIRVATALAVYTAVLFSIAMWLLVSVWPRTQMEYNLTMARTVSIAGIGTSFSIGPETLILIAMILSGTIGACVFSAFAISHHLGQFKDFDKSWTAWYILRPFIGAGLAVIVNLLIRSSVFNIGSDARSLNIVGLSGIAALVGLFSEDVVRKLNKVSDEIFGEVINKASKQNSTNSTP